MTRQHLLEKFADAEDFKYILEGQISAKSILISNAGQLPMKIEFDGKLVRLLAISTDTTKVFYLDGLAYHVDPTDGIHYFIKTALTRGVKFNLSSLEGAEFINIYFMVIKD